MNAYEEKQEKRRERLEARAARLRAEGTRRVERAKEIASFIPFGQPILVGHHSEGRHRADLKRIRGGFERGHEALKAAEAAQARADNIGRGGISSDDPEALVKLRAELQRLAESHSAMKAANKAQPGSVRSYRLTNNNANMARIKKRIAILEANAARTPAPEVERADGVRVVENVEENRLQIIFPGKPDEAMRERLKSRGFRWAPSAGAWQRQLNNAARYAATQILG